MKSNYFLSVDLTSNKKFNKTTISEVKSELELNEDLLDLCILFSHNMDLNFGGYIELYIEDKEFDIDISSDIEDLILKIDSFVMGGWANDSKVEWMPESSDVIYIWFKDDGKWIKVVKPHDRGFLGDDEEWDDHNDISDSYNFGADYDD
jgi:hypothetical protein